MIKGFCPFALSRPRLLRGRIEGQGRSKLNWRAKPLYPDKLFPLFEKSSQSGMCFIHDLTRDP